MTPMRLLLFLLLAVGLPCQADPDAATLRRTLAEVWQQRDYARCIAVAEPLTRADPEDATAWHHLGYALHATGKLDAALAAHERCASLFDRAPEVARLGTYNAACVHALQGRPDQAFTWLRRAVERGFHRAEAIARDEDLVSLRADPRFAELLASIPDARLSVAVVVHHGVELLDFAGPAEVFSSARSPERGPLFHVFLVSPTQGPVQTNNGVVIAPQHTLADAPRCDLLVVPGGNTRVLLDDPAFLAWMRERVPGCKTVLSVCTGAIVLAELGLLDGHEATTHHRSRAGMAARYPKVKVVDRKVVDVGRIVTSAGVSSGIEGALHVVGRLCGNEVADQVAKYIEYSPPENAPAAGR